MNLSQAIQKASRISINVYFGEESIPLNISKAKSKELLGEASDLCGGVHYLDHKFDDLGCIYHAESGAIIAMIHDEGFERRGDINRKYVLFLGV